MDFKQSLDAYLTSLPEDRYDSWCEDVVNALSENFYHVNIDWVEDDAGLFSKWLARTSGHDSKTAAKIIERAHSIFSNKSN
jgi:hypothetical protein